MVFPCSNKLNEKSRLTFLLVVLIFIAGLGARITFLDADPPSFISHYMDYTDEAGKAHNARNFALYGRFIVDEFNEPIFSYPCYTVVLSLVFTLLGAHISIVRLFSIFCCAVVFWLIFLIMRREKFGGAEIVFALLFYWLSSFYLFLNRIGFIEPFLFLWFVLIYGAIQLSVRNARWAVLAGVLFGAAFFSKAFAVIILPAIAACLLYDSEGPRPGRAWTYPYFLIGAAAASILFYQFVVRIDPGQYAAYNSSILNTGLFISSFGRFFPNLLNEYRDLFVLAQFPLTAAFCAGFLFSHLSRDLFAEKRFLIFTLLWFFGALLFLSLITYRPSRYYMLMVPPASILAGIGIGRFLTGERREGLSGYLYCLPIIIGVVFVVLLPLRSILTVGGTPGISTKLVAEASVAAGLCAWLIVFLFRMKRLVYPIVLAGILAFFAFNTAVVCRAYGKPRYETARVSAFIRGLVGPHDALIAGRVDEFIFDEHDYNGYVPYRSGRDLVIYADDWTHLFEERTGFVEHRENFSRAMERLGLMERAVLLGTIRTDVMPDGRRHEYRLYEVAK
jgi:4-amino-4-deoxy-L-arabinose transferase-like glycosyltransferase